MGDNGLKLAIVLTYDDLNAIEDYFSERADADDGHPNAEMNLCAATRRIRALHSRIVAENPLPATFAMYALYGEEL